MIPKEDFVDFILKGQETIVRTSNASDESAFPDGMEGFEIAGIQLSETDSSSSFARRLLEASGFGMAEQVARKNVIRSTDTVAKHLPERVAFWPKTTSRPYQTLLFEANLTHKQLLEIPAFKSRKMAHLDIVEDALARLVSEALEGFQRGGDGVTADVRKGRREETLCVVSILDEREGQQVRLVCFGSWNKNPDGGLETFQITEQTRFWDQQLAKEHLGLLYERQFKKLEGHDWQEAFTTTEERQLAKTLLDICTRRAPKEYDIQEGVLDLLDIIAKGFGLRKRPKTDRRLQAFDLPSDHDIGMDPEERESEHSGRNPFSGVTMRDERNRLLGYIIYPLKRKEDADHLRQHLKNHNRFHNVLVVYPDEEQASFELWQGREPLTGKLRKGQGYKDAADVVNLLSRFFVVSKAKVRNPSELAQELAFRARYLRRLAVKQLEEEPKKGPLRDLYNAFKEALVHNQTEDEFADAFAQTITYGLLTARWKGNDQLIADDARLTRQSALRYLSSTTPFIRDLFKSVLNVKLDEQRGRFLWLLDDIADLLDRLDVTYVFGVGDIGCDSSSDPVIHFYEPFLQAYDARIRMQRGVFYTPRPVVSYIVRSVDVLLRTEFGLSDGLGDTTTWGEMVKRHKDLKIPEGISPNQDFLQILDPATGTGTFLVEVIDVIHKTLATKWKAQGCGEKEINALWNEYVSKHLLTRLHGYELLMAPYTIAHLKIGLKLHETGYRFGSDQRARIFLTNALEPPSDEQLQFEFIPVLAHEAEAVNAIKRKQCFTIVIGNPPYSGLSSNMGPWIDGLLKGRLPDGTQTTSYYHVDGEPLGERKLWLQDDYVKFIRLSQSLLDRSGSGIHSYISNHGYIDNPTFRGMRWSLAQSFQAINILDLHGNLKKKEIPPDGGRDVNVFDIQQGVAIGFFIKGPWVKGGGRHADLWGERGQKYRWLLEHSVADSDLTQLDPAPPFYLFEPFDEGGADSYHDWMHINEIMPVNVTGIVTARDDFVIDFDRKMLRDRIEDLRSTTLSDDAIRRKYFTGKGSKKYPPGDSRGWKLPEARKKLRADHDWNERYAPVLYRPFDIRQMYYVPWMVDWPRTEVMPHLLVGENLGLIFMRQVAMGDAYSHFGVSRLPVDARAFYSNKGIMSFAPLYLYPGAGKADASLFNRWPKGRNGRTPNLNATFIESLAVAVDLSFSSDGRGDLRNYFGPEDVFSYVYSIFHSPGYRKQYEAQLKLNFPQIPLPGNSKIFLEMVKTGNELLALHLLESPKLNPPITEYLGGRSPEIEKVTWSRNTVWLDKAQTTGFKGVREDVWNFHIGGYQVCRKWLDDRRKASRTLNKEDITHYQKIIVVLIETIRIQKEIDKVIDKHGGWPGAFVTNGEMK